MSQNKSQKKKKTTQKRCSKEGCTTFVSRKHKFCRTCHEESKRQEKILEEREKLLEEGNKSVNEVRKRIGDWAFELIERETYLNEKDVYLNEKEAGLLKLQAYLEAWTPPQCATAECTNFVKWNTYKGIWHKTCGGCYEEWQKTIFECSDCGRRVRKREGKTFTKCICCAGKCNLTCQCRQFGVIYQNQTWQMQNA